MNCIEHDNLIKDGSNRAKWKLATDYAAQMKEASDTGEAYDFYEGLFLCAIEAGMRIAENTSDECGEPHDNWPDDSNGMLCQMCWESHCSEEWWKWMVAIDKLHSENDKV